MSPIKAAAAVMLLAFSGIAGATAVTTLDENFEGSLDSLGAAGWSAVNGSTPVGTTSWFKGNTGIFEAQAGSADSYLAANFLTAANNGAGLLFLLSPELMLGGSTRVSFYTRTDDPSFGDRLAFGWLVGDQLTLLDNIGSATPYPSEWTRFDYSFFPVFGGDTIGRLVWAYNFDPEGGSYIGIDSLAVRVPEPGTLALFGIALGGLALTRRRRNV
jgi:hypothetical protein